MTNNPLRPCRKPGCKVLHRNRSGYCDHHAKEDYKRYAYLDAARESAHNRGYDATWKRLRTMQLNEEPLCRMCKEKGKLTPAVLVDHINSIEERPDLRLDQGNRQSLCRSCHDSKHRRINVPQM